MKNKSPLKKAITIIFSLIGLFLLYVIGAILYATVTDYQPEDALALRPRYDAKVAAIQDSTLSFMTWNIGYGGLGAKSDFFYEDEGSLRSGKSAVRPDKATSDAYFAGIQKTIKDNPVDFYLLQEVDTLSKRGHYRNQLKGIHDVIPDYFASFATNYNVKRVPLPVLEPWDVYGKVVGGLGTYAKYQPDIATRLQLPGNYSWPTRVFQLDRCVAYHEFPLASGKKIVVMNVHNSAFDKGGKLKKQQMAFIQNLAMDAYKQGNYVVVGGDWNQNPPGFRPQTYQPGYTTKLAIPIDASAFPEDWVWVYAPDFPTNRSVKDPYVPGKTPVTTIDFFLLSPNVQALKVQVVDLDFAFSDHQPVKMQVLLK
ncbi:MAG TPA: endonuclease/exonuclease/phosphatase family protein [Saprospiraceae bacterium]|nr:endonuclease/exonuclease/phosphatase family protein [Saprospiraceae bacterium]